MLDISQLTDSELKVLLRGINLIKASEVSIYDVDAYVNLHSVMSEEANKRCLEVVPRWQ